MIPNATDELRLAQRGNTAPHLRSGSKTSRTAGVVLAGVHSWRADVLEAVACKLLLPVALRPLIGYSLDWLGTRIDGKPHICANGETGILRHCLDEISLAPRGLSYFEDRMPRGPAGCVRDAVVDSPADAIVVVEGTILPRFDLETLLDAHHESRAALTVAVEETTELRSGRTVEPIGVYVFSREALAEIPATGYQDIKEGLIPRLYAAGRRVLGHRVPAGSAPRVTGISSYVNVNMCAISHMSAGGTGPKGFTRRGNAWVHETAVIDPNARIKGAVLIGPDCHVSAGSLLIGPTVLGQRCTLQRDTVVTRTVMWDRCTVGSGAIVDHSVLTSGTSVEPGIVARHAVFAPSKRDRRH